MLPVLIAAPDSREKKIMKKKNEESNKEILMECVERKEGRVTGRKKQKRETSFGHYSGLRSLQATGQVLGK
jgi:hypothetical protein